ncbi:MAG TPA: VTT domain-containing protein, partial [Patescibacteria group bacterium]|nr:VTT domain-containing protein [Patescibacteria group bacterium]
AVLKDFKDQVAMVYSCSTEDGVTKPVRIHSKLMIVDDKYLRIGSTNINRRSMGFDTECDIILTGDDEKIRRKIADVRNDLIREHSGQELDDIEYKVTSGASVQRLLDDVPTSRQHFRPWADEQFRSPAFARLATAIADPVQPFIPSELTLEYKHPSLRRHIGRQVTSTLALMVLIAAFVALWRYTPLAEYATPEKVMPLFESLRQGPAGIWLAILLFTTATFLFFPVTVMIGASAAVFGPVIGLFVSVVGVAATSTLGFMAGKVLGQRVLRMVFGQIGERVREYLNHGGARAIAVLRLIPVAPFNAVNLGLGISGLSFLPYILGTLIGMLPGMVAISWLGHSFMQLWESPDRQAIALAAAGIAGWIAFTLFAQFTLRRWQERHFPKAIA